jgi:putative hemolysin
VTVYYLLRVIAAGLAVAGVAFFAGGETAFISSDRFRIRGMARRGVRGAAAARWLLGRPNMFVSMALVGTNICVILASSLTTDLLGAFLGKYAVIVSTLGMTSIILLFGEIAPKAVGRANPEAFMVAASPYLVAAYYLLYPLARAMASVASLVTLVSGSKERSSAITRGEIRALVKEAAQTGFGLTPNTYAHRALDLSRMKVTGVMLPMDDVVSLDAEATVSEALEIASKRGYSRYPVYRKTQGDLVGILHIKDLLGVPGDSRVHIFTRSGNFVPETATIKQVMPAMREDLRHLAVVTDEYGRAIGILTFEDLVEEIVGEIHDEYDRARGARILLDQAISGNTPVALVNEELETGIPEGTYSTLAGFILSHLGSIPRTGDRVEIGDFVCHITEVKGRRIRRVRIARKESAE